MKRAVWFVHFLKKSLSERKSRIITSSLAITLGAALSVVLFTVSIGIGQKLGEELKAYGANLVIVPSEEYSYIDEDMLMQIPLDKVEGLFYQLYGRIDVGEFSVEVVGVDFSKMADAAKWWRIHSRWPSNSQEILMGVAIKEAFKYHNIGQETMEYIELQYSIQGEKSTGKFKVVGFLETGGKEDKSLFMDIKEAQRILGLHKKVSAVFLRAKKDIPLSTASMEIQRAIPSVEVKTIREVAYAEKALLKKIQFLMAIVTLIVLISSGISVASTMMTTIIERRKEIGLMKALGGTKAEIRAFFTSEAFIIGITGGIIGFLFGSIFAQIIGKSSFGSFIPISPYALLLSVFVGIAISVISSFLPVRSAMRLSSSPILRGE